MLIVYILIGTFFISLSVVVSMLAYKIFKIEKEIEITYENDVYKIISFHSRKILEKTLKEGTKLSIYFLFFVKTKAHPVLKKIIKISKNYYNDFLDSVNGKNEAGERGTASFFLKTVKEHKEKNKK